MLDLADEDGEGGARLGAGAVLGALFQQHEIALVVDGAVIVDDLALKHEELLVACMLMRLAPGARGHAVDVEPRAFRKSFIKLKEALARNRLAIGGEGLERGGRDIDDETVG